jgi:hypothetical protein
MEPRALLDKLETIQAMGRDKGGLEEYKVIEYLWDYCFLFLN